MLRKEGLSKLENIELKPGQSISIVVYSGTSDIEVMATYEFLKYKKDNKELVLVKGTRFNLRIEEVLASIEPNHPFKACNYYEITVKGVLE